MSFIKHEDGVWTAMASNNGVIVLATGATRAEARENAITKLLMA